MGDTYCRVCLAAFARTSLLAHQLVPLQCCQRRVPLEWIAQVLEPAEAIYYRFLTTKRTDGTPERTAETAETQTATARIHCTTCYQQLQRDAIATYTALACGHVYCWTCLATLVDLSAEPSCCAQPSPTDVLQQLKQQPQASTPSRSAAAVASAMIVIDDDDEQTEERLGPFDSAIRRTSERPESELANATATSREINLVDQVETTQHDVIDADAIELTP